MAESDRTEEPDELADAKKEFAADQEAWAENQRLALEDFRFARLSEQWPEKIRKERELEGRPVLTINKLPAFIRQVVNDARQNKPQIAVHPVDSGADPETAQIMSGLIRHIERNSDADVAYDTSIDHSATGGFGFFGINSRYVTDKGFEQELIIERFPNPMSVIPPRDSTAADSSDWNRAWVIETLEKADFEKAYPEKDAVSWSGETVRDLKDRTVKDGETVTICRQWVRVETTTTIVALSPPSEEAVAGAPPEALDQAQSLVDESLVVELSVYEANKALFDALGVAIIGEPRDVPSYAVEQRTWSGAELLKTRKWAGKFIPIVPVYGEDINVEGVRHLRGLVRDATDAQRMFNYWRTTSTELVALAPKAPFIGRKGAFDTDAAKWATANVQSHAYLEYDVPEGEGDIGPPQRQPFAGVPAGALQEALNASDDMKSIMGVYDASLGARSNETSGRAIMARQREGDVSTFHYIDNLSRAIRHAGRILIDLIPKVYNTPRIIRVLGPEGDEEAVQIQAQTTRKVRGEDGQMQEISKVFDFGAGQYDLTVSAGPSFTSRREEAAMQMMEFIQSFPAAAPLIGDLLAKNLDWPGADEIADRLKAMLPAQLQGDNPEARAAQQQAEQLGQALAAAKAEISALKQDRANEAKQTEIDAYEAETGRLKTIAPKGVPYDAMQMAPLVAAALGQILQSPDVLPLIQRGAPPEEIMAAMSGGAMQPPREPPPAAAAAAEPNQPPPLAA